MGQKPSAAPTGSPTPTAPNATRIPFKTAFPTDPMKWTKSTSVPATPIPLRPSAPRPKAFSTSTTSTARTFVPKQTPTLSAARKVMQSTSGSANISDGMDLKSVEAAIVILHRARNEIVLFSDNVQHAYRETELLSPHPALRQIAEELMADARNMQTRLEIFMSGENASSARTMVMSFGTDDGSSFNNIAASSGRVLDTKELDRLSMLLDVPDGVIASDYALSVVESIGGVNIGSVIARLEEQSLAESGGRRTSSLALKDKLISIVMLAQSNVNARRSSELQVLFESAPLSVALEFVRPQFLRHNNPTNTSPILRNATLAALARRLLPDPLFLVLAPEIDAAGPVRLRLVNELKLRGGDAINELFQISAHDVDRQSTMDLETLPIVRWLTNPTDTQNDPEVAKDLKMSSAAVLDIFFENGFAGTRAERQRAANILELTIADRSIPADASREAKRSLAQGLGLMLQDDELRKTFLDTSIGVASTDVKPRELLASGMSVRSADIRAFYGELSTDEQAYSATVRAFVFGLGKEVANATDVNGNIDLAKIHVDAANAFGNLARGIAEKAENGAARDRRRMDVFVEGFEVAAGIGASFAGPLATVAGIGASGIVSTGAKLVPIKEKYAKGFIAKDGESANAWGQAIAATLLFRAMPVEQRNAVKEKIETQSGDSSFIDAEHGVISLPDLASVSDPELVMSSLGQVTTNSELDKYINRFGNETASIASNRKR